MGKTKRTVKTLLLCKINPQADVGKGLYSKLQGIYKGKNGTSYATIGKVDGISIYDTIDDHSKWLEYVYRDRTTIIHKSNASIRYHPIHLVANEAYSPRSDIAKCCAVVTLIYGVNVENARSENEKRVDREPFVCFEKVIKQWLATYGKNNFPKNKGFVKEFEVYNAINICDVVVIHYTKNLKKSMEVMNSFGEEMIARKTLSLICFPVDWLNNCATGKDLKILRKLDDGKCKSRFSIRVEGSIRNQTEFDEIYDCLKTQYEASLYSDIVFGQSDFCLQFFDFSAEEVDNLLKILFSKHTDIEKACWELYTEFLKPYKVQSASNKKRSNDPTNILGSLYNNYFKFAEKFDSDKDPKNLPWYNMFYELLTVNTNIDSDPVLHGPSYLIYRFAKILHEYIEKYIDESDESSIYTNIMEKSDRIADAVQDLSNLTDYILRNDDLIFHGFGNCSALYNTLPECALDFYHSMLLCIVEYLYKCDIYFCIADEKIIDEKTEEKIKKYCYDFLLLPNAGYSVKVDELFCVESELMGNPFGIANPVKQVYLVAFPVQKAYSPFIFFTQLVHECFHYLGDVCRLRNKRSSYLYQFTADLIIIDWFGELTISVKERVKKDIISILERQFEGVNNPNKKRSLELLSSGIMSLFSGETLTKLRAITKHTWSLYAADNESVVAVVENEIEICMYYFREGYADLMMILLLQLTPAQYYSLFTSDKAIYKTKKEKAVLDTLRISLVSAVLNGKINDSCYKNNDSLQKWGQDKTVLNQMKAIILPELRPEYMISYYEALKKNVGETPDPNFEEGKAQICPISCMLHVKSYLKDVFDTFVEKYETVSQTSQLWEILFGASDANPLFTIRSRFKNFFVDDNLFSEDFFKVIYEDHEKVRDMLKEEGKLTSSQD